jgi:transcriptional regulator with XRE-family HTH domain
MDRAVSLGERLRELRTDRGATQEQLAARASLSVDLVKKLEQGQRDSARLSTLVALANALDVPLSELTDKRPRLKGGTERLVLGLRDVVLAPSLLPGVGAVHDDDPTPVPVLERLVSRAWQAYWSGHFTDLARSTPQLIVEARATHNALGREVAGHLAQAYQLAACLLVQLGRDELAASAVERGLAAAKTGDDELQWAAICGTYCWVLLSQARPEEAQQLAVQISDRIEPRISKATAPHLTAWGGLVLWALAAAVAAGNPSSAAEYIALGRAGAARLPADRHDYQVNFGPSQVAMQATYAHANLGEPERALDAATNVQRGDLLPISYGRHLLDVAVAHGEQRQDEQAVDVLHEAAALAPVWFRHQGVARSLAGEIRRRHPRPSAALRGLVEALGDAAEHNTSHI